LPSPSGANFEAFTTMTFQVEVFWFMTQCSVVMPSSSHWRWRQHGCLKRRYPTTALHYVTTQRTGIFIRYSEESTMGKVPLKTWRPHPRFSSVHCRASRDIWNERPVQTFWLCGMRQNRPLKHGTNTEVGEPQGRWAWPRIPLWWKLMETPEPQTNEWSLAMLLWMACATPAVKRRTVTSLTQVHRAYWR
jgi:hypothetical protein